MAPRGEPLIFERGSPGRVAYSLPASDVPALEVGLLLPKPLLRGPIEGFPEVSEVEVVRHFTRLARLNYGVDQGPYPLGSCTMKYNPKVHEEVARLAGFAQAHPYQPEQVSQGALQVMYELEQYLAEISGMDRVTLQPAAGAHGELTGLLMIRACLSSRGDPRRKILIPDTAHGTNPSSSQLCGYEVLEVRSNARGCVDSGQVAKLMDETVAAVMVTNPNTLGLFEEEILQVADVVHRRGGFLYGDGANLNALMGVARPGDMGFDVMQFNLHKTFTTPHGGGGPGAGPVGVKQELAPFLPVPVIERSERGVYRLNHDLPHSIGKVKAFYGHFAVLVRAYAYIRSMGAAHLKRASQVAVLNANYLISQLKGYYDLPFDRPCMHECVFSEKVQAKDGIHAIDIAKRLIDYGLHPPTIYFPLVVKGALMIEPTETESRESLDELVWALQQIAREAKEDPQLLSLAPTTTAVSRLDETKAARQPRLRWRPVR